MVEFEVVFVLFEVELDPVTFVFDDGLDESAVVFVDWPVLDELAVWVGSTGADDWLVGD